MMTGIKKNLHWYLLLAFLVSFVILALQSTGTEGGADDINHYRYARYAFDHPEYFFNTKAKTVFTLLRAPIAQLGYDALKIFNVILGLAAALLTFLVARRLDYENPILGIFLLVFAPMYTLMMLSGMNEVMFSFFLILGIFLFFRSRYIWSAFVISLLPFIRTEGFVIFPVFLLAFALLKEWKAIPFLVAGFLLVSFAGSFHYGDIFWVINENPYSGDAADIYGSGPLLHYVNRFRGIFGLPFFILILGGLLYIPIRYFSLKTSDRLLFVNEVLIGFMPFLAYFVAHSYVYWKGMGNSVGLTRVIAAVMPSAVLLAVFGWNGLMRILKMPEISKNIFAAVLAVYLIFVPFRVHRIPVELGPTQQLIREAVSWLDAMDYTDRKIYFWDPFWWFFLDLDPTDEIRVHEGLRDRSNPGRNILPGEIVLWDAHFGPNEGRTPLASLKDNPDFVEIKVFRPNAPFQVLGGYDYEIHVFERLDDRLRYDEQTVLDEIRKKEDSLYQLRLLDYEDFEPGTGIPDSINHCSHQSKSGSYSARLHQGRVYLTGIETAAGSIGPASEARLSVGLSYYFEEVLGEDPLYLVVSLENGRKITFYKSWEIQPECLRSWEDTLYEVDFPPVQSKSDILKVYLWNLGGHIVCIDDLIIALKEPRE